MRGRLMVPLLAVSLVVGAIAFLAGRDGPAPVATSGARQSREVEAGLPARTVDAGGVRVRIEPLAIDEMGAAFLVTLDTHEGASPSISPGAPASRSGGRCGTPGPGRAIRRAGTTGRGSSSSNPRSPPPEPCGSGSEASPSRSWCPGNSEVDPGGIGPPGEVWKGQGRDGLRASRMHLRRAGHHHRLRAGRARLRGARERARIRRRVLRRPGGAGASGGRRRGRGEPSRRRLIAPGGSHRAVATPVTTNRDVSCDPVRPENRTGSVRRKSVRNRPPTYQRAKKATGRTVGDRCGPPVKSP